MTPRFGPLVVLAVLPLAAAVLGVIVLRRTGGGVHRRMLLLVAALAEVLWALCTLAMVGFSVARHSG